MVKRIIAQKWKSGRGSNRGIPPPDPSLIDFAVVYHRLGSMGSTTRGPSLYREVSPLGSVGLLDFRDGARRPPSLTLDRLHSLGRIDWVARLRLLDMIERLACLDTLG